jgi:hypothetical protein
VHQQAEKLGTVTWFSAASFSAFSCEGFCRQFRSLLRDKFNGREKDKFTFIMFLISRISEIGYKSLDRTSMRKRQAKNDCAVGIGIENLVEITN